MQPNIKQRISLQKAEYCCEWEKFYRRSKKEQLMVKNKKVGAHSWYLLIACFVSQDAKYATCMYILSISLNISFISIVNISISWNSALYLGTQNLYLVKFFLCPLRIFFSLVRILNASHCAKFVCRVCRTDISLPQSYVSIEFWPYLRYAEFVSLLH